MSKIIDDVKTGLKGIRGAGDAIRGEALDATDQVFDTDPRHPETLKDSADNRAIADKGKQDMRGVDDMIARREWKKQGVEPPAHVQRDNEKPLAADRPNEGLSGYPDEKPPSTSRYEEHLVSMPFASFYGPGNIASWLCMVVSVVTTWCLNAEYRRKDSISADLVVVLAVPGVAAGHAIYMLFFGNSNHESILHLFTSADSEVVKHAAAAEAALDVCETFSAIAVLLVFVSMFFGHLRRTLAVVTVGLLAFSTEAVVFTQMKGVRVSDTNLTRPFLFNFFEVMVSLVVFVAVWLAVFSIFIMWLRLGIIEEPEEQKEMESVDPELEIEVRAALVGQALDIDSAVRLETQQQSAMALQFTEGEARHGNAMRFLTLLSIPLSLLATFASISTPLGALGETSFIPSPNSGVSTLFFVPRTTTDITELDQMVSLCIGIITLLFSLWDTFISQKKVESRARQKTREQAAHRGRNRRQRRLNAGLYFLRQVNDELEETTDEARRQELLDKRNLIMVELFRMVGS
ncbi:uncharacterized protein FSUBG_7752 [Fusarium subglutinans]|uniref:Uncharacterized protein n=1 Tax=Gibberella subglutinans TaxID=42677 RepID=A0A8H5PSS3_GIBSU|nr:uncharacterized protein FSUBG_7752 [Fusarium subglutinans]KAF5602445.1 hypothetical protein FSUBG_7752 [Fusarium subglutinans]